MENKIIIQTVEFELTDKPVREGTLVYYEIEDDDGETKTMMTGIDRILSYDKQQKVYDLEFRTLCAYRHELKAVKINKVYDTKD